MPKRPFLFKYFAAGGPLCLNAAIIEGDRFHRYDRTEMKRKLAEAPPPPASNAMAVRATESRLSARTSVKSSKTHAVRH